MKIRRHLNRALALLLLTIAASAGAADFGFSQLMSAMSAVTQSRGSFVERKQLAMLSAPLQLSGELVYVRPNYVEKRVTSPYSERFVVEGGKLTYENRQGQVRTLSLRMDPVAWALAESIRATLAGDGKALSRLYEPKVEGSPAQWQLTLTPREEDIAQYLVSIRFNGTQSRVTRIEVTETGGDTSAMTIQSRKD